MQGESASTRRQVIKAGTGLAVGTALAGCADGTETGAGESGDGSYSVTMSPVGTVEFEQPPQDVLVYSLLYADMAVAYGSGDAVNSLGFSADAGGRTLDAYYNRLDGVSFDREGLVQLNEGTGGISVDIEQFYELDSDLHLVDPALIVSFDGWNVDDIEELKTQVAPFFGNEYSRNNSQPTEPYRDDYEYYTLWEIAEKVAQVFDARQRYDALAAVHDEMRTDIEANLPPEDERPTVASLIYVGETFYPFKSTTPGFANAHVRPLEPVDAFIDEEVSYQSSYDFETMLDLDPDIILHRFGVASYYNVPDIKQTLADHDLGSRLSAVQNDRIYPSANPLQGPLMNLFQLEMTAKQLYPEQFGDWPGYAGDGPYPEIPEDEQLFDRQRVADIVNGGL